MGCSPSARRTVRHTVERLMLDTATAWEKEGVAHGERRPVIGAVDATFLQRMMLVCMALPSGYVFMEEVAVDRRDDTWSGGITGRLTTLGPVVLSLGSNRAKALIKLAHTGLGCLSIPDVFPLSHDLATGYSLAIFGRLRQAKHAREHALQRLQTLQGSPSDRALAQQAQTAVEACERVGRQDDGDGRGLQSSAAVAALYRGRCRQ